MSLNPEIKAYFELHPEQKNNIQTPIVPLSLRPHVHSVEDRVVPTEEYNIPIRIYTPEGKGPFPLFVFFHGGGWVSGNLESHDVNCRQIVIESGYKVVAVDYRLAPSYPFPAASNDCYAVTKWVSENAEELNGDVERIAVGGPSAGGNLAAAVALMARDRKEFQLFKQVLIYPATDLEANEDRHRSFKEYAHGYGMSIHSENPYLAKKEDIYNPYASPLQANDLTGLPPALILTAEYDPLRDEGEEYALRLIKAGIHTECKRFKGTIHGFMYHFSNLDDYKEGFKLVGLFLKKQVIKPVRHLEKSEV